MAYTRLFMTLVSEAKGYEFKGRPPGGRCIVESRNNAAKLSLWVQDLRPEMSYDIYMVFAQERQHIGLSMGKINVDERGKGEFRREITSAELHNFNLAEVVTVAVTTTDASGIVSPLCGYKGAQVSWRHSFRVWEKEEVNVEPPPKVEDTSPVVLEQPPVMEVAAEVPAAIEEPLPATETPPVHDRPNHTFVEPISNVARSNPPRATKPQVAPVPHDITTSYPQRTDIIQLLETIFSENTPFEPHVKHAREIKWVRCTNPAQIPLPNSRPHLMSEPFMLNAWADHEHFILGITTGGEPMQYIIGMAGTYSSESDVMAKNLGFSLFSSHKKEHPHTGDDGYWLMFVDI